MFSSDKQTALIEKMHEQNLELSAAHHSPDLHEIFSTIKVYQNKLVNIKKDMRSLHEKSTKLKVLFKNVLIFFFCIYFLLIFRNVPYDFSSTVKKKHIQNDNKKKLKLKWKKN